MLSSTATTTTTTTTATTTAAATAAAAASSSSYITTLYKARKTLIKHLQRAGFETTKYEQFTVEEVEIMHANQLLNIYVRHKQDDSIAIVQFPSSLDGAPIYTNAGEELQQALLAEGAEGGEGEREVLPAPVLMVTPSTFTKTSLHKCVTQMFERPVPNVPPLLRAEKDWLILISDEDVSESVNFSACQYFDNRPVNDRWLVTLFSLSSLQFDLFSVALVPSCRILTETETTTFMKRYSISHPNQLPTILRNDPMAKALFLRVNQIIEIKRYSPSAGRAMFYPTGKGLTSIQLNESTMQTIAAGLATKMQTFMQADQSFLLAMYHKLAEFTRSIDVMEREFSDGNVMEVSQLLTADVYAALSQELVKLALDECLYPDYEQLRLSTLRTLTGLYKSILEYAEYVSIDSQLIACREKMAILSNPQKLQDYLDGLRRRHTSIFPDSEIQVKFARLKPQYAIYIQRFGYPQSGVFDPTVLGNIMKEINDGICCQSC